MRVPAFGIASCLVWSVLLARGLFGEELQDGQEFENLPGWAWIIEPFPLADDPRENVQMNGGMVLLAEKGPDGEWIILSASPGRGRAPVGQFHAWRPIAFDDQGQRCRLRPWFEMGSRVPEGDHWVFMARYTWQPDAPPGRAIAHVGLEGLTTEGYRAKAQEAAREAKERGFDTLPFPQVGEVYAFKLVDLDGNVIDSRDLKGKVVLLDFWATWCLPCVQKMPELKELHERWHSEGFEIIGINFDDDRQTCHEAIAKYQLPWTQCMVPVDKDIKKLWMAASTVESLPRLLLIDRNGLLHADVDHRELESEVDNLMSASRGLD